MLGRMFKGAENREAEFLQGMTPWGDWNLAAPAASGVHVTERSAQQLLAVYGCIQLIAGTISTLPRHVLREEDGTEIGTPPKWFRKPNSSTTMTEFLSQTVTSLLLDGNAYWAYGIDGNGMPNELTVIDPQQVTVKQTAGAIAPTVAYEVNGRPFRGKMVHLKGICAPGQVVGISPIEAARQSIGVGLAAQEFAARFYSNGASLSGVIETDADLTLQQAKETVRKFAGDHVGLANAHRPGIIDNGATWKPLTIAPSEAQFLESRQYQSAEICSQMFLVDPAWFGMALGTGSNVTYNNLESQGVRLSTFTLARWLVTIETAFYDLLPRPWEFKFNLDGLKRGDLTARAAYYEKGIASGWLDKQEARDFENLGPMPASLKNQPQPPAQQMQLPLQTNARPPTIHNHISPQVHIEPPPTPEVHFFAESPRSYVTVNVPDFPEFPEQRAPVVHNHVATPTVNVAAADAPEVRVNVENTPADVTVNVPDIKPVVHNHVETPTVNVAPAEAPVVNVRNETVQQVRKRLVRDEDGRAVAVEEWTDPNNKTVREIIRDESGRIIEERLA